jgi:hypothetical protein
LRIFAQVAAYMHHGNRLAGQGIIMETIFDIFRRLPDGKPLWIESIQGLHAAKDRLAYLVSATPGEYFIYSEKSGGVVVAFNSVREKHQAA